VAASECDNIYLEPSWCSIHYLKWLVKRLCTERILFGSDVVANLPIELLKYRSLGLSEEDLDNILGRTAQRIFRI